MRDIFRLVQGHREDEQDSTHYYIAGYCIGSVHACCVAKRINHRTYRSSAADRDIHGGSHTDTGANPEPLRDRHDHAPQFSGKL